MSERSELWAVPRRREKRWVPAAQRPDRVPGCAFFLVTLSLHKERKSDSLDAKRRVKALLSIPQHTASHAPRCALRKEGSKRRHGIP
jgi:hypothetical protein